MALNFNGNGVDHIIYKTAGGGTSYVRELKQGTSGNERIVWEEKYGTYAVLGGIFPIWFNTLTALRMASSEPTAETNVQIGEGDVLYNNDTLTFSATAAPYYTVSVANPIVIVSTPGEAATTRESTLYGFTASGVTGSRKMRDFEFDLSNGIANVVVTYTDSEGKGHTDTLWPTSSSTVSVSAWCGKSVTCVPTAVSAYELADTAITIDPADKEATAKIKPVANPYKWTEVTSICTGCDTVANGTTASLIDAAFVIGGKTYGGLSGFEKVRVSGSIEITLGVLGYSSYSNTVTKTFENVELTYDADTVISTYSGGVGVRGSSKVTLYGASGNITMTSLGRDVLRCSVSNTWDTTTDKAVIKGLSMKLTSVQVYVPFQFDTECFEQSWVYADGSIEMASARYVGRPVDLYAVGTFETSSGPIEATSPIKAKASVPCGEDLCIYSWDLDSEYQSEITSCDALYAIKPAGGKYFISTLGNGN